MPPLTTTRTTTSTSSIIITMLLLSTLLSPPTSLSYIIPTTSRRRMMSRVMTSTPTLMRQTTRLQRQTFHRFHSSSSSSLATLSPSYDYQRRPKSRLYATISTSSSSSSSTTTSSSSSSSSLNTLLGIDFIKTAIVTVLNSQFSPSDVARNRALAKLDGGGGKKKKKKKKKKNNNNDYSPEDETKEDEEPPQLSEEQKRAIGDAAAASATPFTFEDAMVTPATRDEFGDYQCNAAMGLAKSVGMSPRDCAASIVDGLKPLIGHVMEEPEIAGPGFINLKFKEDYLSNAIRQMSNDPERLAIPLTSQKQKIIVDFSSPNIAKEMHVGHLRSTIIGDTLSNILTFAGHDVLRLNHVGDWGTQFGMLVEHLKENYPEALLEESAAVESSSSSVNLGDLVEFYKAAKRRFDEDEEFKARARQGVVKLQGGEDEESLTAWRALCAASRVEYDKIYSLLNIRNLEERGESFYNPFLSDIVSDLESRGLAVESDGATAVFLNDAKFCARDGSALPLIVKKSDGGYNYATTDLAAIRHRVSVEGADRVLYVTDAGQSQHFEMVFAAATMAGLLDEGKKGEKTGGVVSLEHVPFGLVQGEDGKKFATRSGETVKLRDLLDESIRIAGEDVTARWDDNVTDEVKHIIQTVGIGAVKYADLSLNRESNYRFSYERMLSLNGNTAPYMLYAYARICGIVRKATADAAAAADNEEDGSSSSTASKMTWPAPAEKIIIKDDSELQLIRNLIKLPDVLRDVETFLYPNKICDYLFETSQKFNQFYENCAVNNAETPELKASRLTLCTVTASTIRLLMGMLGIQVVERL